MSFGSRRFRALVILRRKKLRGTGTVIVEDLSPRRYALLCNVKDDTEVCKLAWSVIGKIDMTADNGMTVQVKDSSDLSKLDSRVRWSRGNQPQLSSATKRPRGGGKFNRGNRRGNDAETVMGDDTATCLSEAIFIAYSYALILYFDMIIYGCRLESKTECFVCKLALGHVTAVTWPNGIWMLPMGFFFFSIFASPTLRRFSGKRPIKRGHCVKLVVPCLFLAYLFLLHALYCS